MKLPIIIGLSLALALAQLASAGESCLRTTYQPLAAPAVADIWIVPVTCHHWYCSSADSSVDLIAVKNVPPTDMPDQAKEDLNLASLCHVKFSTSDLGRKDVPLKIVMDVTEFKIPKRFSEFAPDVVIRACLECLRRCTGGRLLRIPVTLKVSEKNEKWVGKIVAEFNAHDRSKVFYTFRR